MSDRRWWYISTGVALSCLGLIVLQWYLAITEYRPRPDQLTNRDEVQVLLDAHRAEKSPAQATEILEVPTGLFIRSFQFLGASDINLTGYIWQRYDRDIHSELLAEFDDFKERPGFLLPEQVSSNDYIVGELYRHVDTTTKSETDAGKLTIGWFFDVNLRQPFDYSHYPLDQHELWLRIRHQKFDGDVILVPDLEAYDSTARGIAFGLDSAIVSGGWMIDETFFLLRENNYDTNFGMLDVEDLHTVPELYFTVAVSRIFRNAFIINLVPLLVVLALLFSVMMTVTADDDKISVFGFSTAGTMGTASALFFVVMLAHISLREEFSGAGVVYLEWFYLITYVVILLISLNIYVFTAEVRWRGFGFVFYRDNLIPKIGFWPCTMFALALVTLAFF